jgi:hypothetical protein
MTAAGSSVVLLLERNQNQSQDLWKGSGSGSSTTGNRAQRSCTHRVRSDKRSVTRTGPYDPFHVVVLPHCFRNVRNFRRWPLLPKTLSRRAIICSLLPWDVCFCAARRRLNARSIYPCRNAQFVTVTYLEGPTENKVQVGRISTKRPGTPQSKGCG